MTIEIKQLVIRASVENHDASAARSREVSPEPRFGANAPDFQPAKLDQDYEAIIATCVREVLRRIKKFSER